MSSLQILIYFYLKLFIYKQKNEIMKTRTFIYLAILMLSTMQIVAQTNYFRLDTVLRKDLTNSGAIVGRQSFDYNTSGLQTQKISYSYAGGNTYGSKKEWIYDSSTEYINEVDYFNYDSGNSTWTMGFKEEYTQYDADGNLLEKISSYYDSNNSVWVFSQKIQYFYTTSIIDSLKRFYFDATSSSWKNQSKDLYTYTSGVLTLKYTKQWDAVNNQYIESSKEHYTYNANNLLTEYRYEYYDTNTSSWIDASKTIRTYDATSSQNLLTKEEYYWDININVWKGNSKDVFTYDSNGNVDSVETFMFDNGNNTWNSFASNINTGIYDNQIDRNSLIIPEDYTYYFYDNFFNHKLDTLHTTTYNSSTNTQDPYQDLEFIYSQITIVGVSEDIELNEVGIYPNPVNSFVNIKGTENLSDYKIIIYDMQGRQIFHRSNQSKINVQLLSSGSYMYKIIAEEGVKTGVLLKN